MSCPRPHSKSLRQPGCRRGVMVPRGRVGHVPPLWLRSKRIWICEELANDMLVLSSQRWSGCHLTSEKSMSLYGNQRVQNVVYLVFAATGQDRGLPTCFRGWSLSCHRYLSGGSGTSSQIWGDMGGQRNRRHSSLHYCAYILVGGSSGMQVRLPEPLHLGLVEIFSRWNKPRDSTYVTTATAQPEGMIALC